MKLICVIYNWNEQERATTANHTRTYFDFDFIPCFRIKDANYGDGEDDLKHFLERENDLMANRLKSGDRTFDPYTKDTRLVDEKCAKLIPNKMGN